MTFTAKKLYGIPEKNNFVFVNENTGKAKLQGNIVKDWFTDLRLNIFFLS